MGHDFDTTRSPLNRKELKVGWQVGCFRIVRVDHQCDRLYFVQDVISIFMFRRLSKL